MARAGKSTSTSPTKKSADVDAYIAAAPKAVQPRLRELRKTIQTAAPKAEERISYGIVGYFYGGRLIYFAVHRNHIGLYPSGDAKGLEKYLHERATLQFPHDEPLPLAKIRKLVSDRVAERDAGKAIQMLPSARRSSKTRSTSRAGASASRRASHS